MCYISEMRETGRWGEGGRGGREGRLRGRDGGGGRELNVLKY